MLMRDNHPDVQRIIDSTSTDDLANMREVMTRGRIARDMMADLRRSPEWVAKYARNDPKAVELFRHLTQAIADMESTPIRAAVQGREPDAMVNASEAQARLQSMNAMLNDKDFAKRFADGDQNAVRQWREVAVDRTASLLGIDKADVAPAPAAAPVNPYAPVEGTGE